MTTILSLDLGTQTGWAVLKKEHITSGTISFKNDRYHGGGMRYLLFSRWLDHIESLCNRSITAVYFEEVRRHLGVDAAHAYGGFLATLTAWCEQRNIPYQGVSVGTIKHHVTGKGNATKEAVMDAMRKKGYTLLQDDNEADALALLEWARDHHNRILGFQPETIYSSQTQEINL
jgi:Holliday junction resolvasome RuvABC endonuclease subunit